MFNKKEIVAASKKYKEMLLPIKVKLMKEIASHLKNGKFNMTKQTVIHYPMVLGEMFPAKFDFIEGDEKKLKLKDSSRPYMTVIGFDSDNEVNVSNDITFLMTLLDYMNMDL